MVIDSKLASVSIHTLTQCLKESKVLYERPLHNMKEYKSNMLQECTEFRQVWGKQTGVQKQTGFRNTRAQSQSLLQMFLMEKLVLFMYLYLGCFGHWQFHFLKCCAEHLYTALWSYLHVFRSIQRRYIWFLGTEYYILWPCSYKQNCLALASFYTWRYGWKHQEFLMEWMHWMEHFKLEKAVLTITWSQAAPIQPVFTLPAV